MVIQPYRELSIRKAVATLVFNWKLQAVYYATIFFVALATALITDFVLGQSPMVAAAVSVSVAVLLLCGVPAIALLLDRAERRTIDHAEIRTHLNELVGIVHDLGVKIDAAGRAPELPLSARAVANLELLGRTSHASALQIVQNILFSDVKLRINPDEDGHPAAITVPFSVKGLLETLAAANGFISGEKYLEFVLEAKANKIREDDEKQREEMEARRKMYQADEYRQIDEMSLPRPNRSADRWGMRVEAPIIVNKSTQ